MIWRLTPLLRSSEEIQYHQIELKKTIQCCCVLKSWAPSLCVLRFNAMQDGSHNWRHFWVKLLCLSGHYTHAHQHLCEMRDFGQHGTCTFAHQACTVRLKRSQKAGGKKRFRQAACNSLAKQTLAPKEVCFVGWGVEPSPKQFCNAGYLRYSWCCCCVQGDKSNFAHLTSWHDHQSLGTWCVHVVHYWLHPQALVLNLQASCVCDPVFLSKAQVAQTSPLKFWNFGKFWVCWEMCWTPSVFGGTLRFVLL